MLQSSLSAILKRQYNKILRDQLTPGEAQEKAFRRLQAKLRRSEIYRSSELSRAKNLNDYARLAQVRTYEDYKQTIKTTLSAPSRAMFSDPLQYVGLSSGTTSGDCKALPYNKAMLKTWERYQLAMAAILQEASSISLIKDQRLIWGSTPIVRKDERGLAHGYVSGFLSMRSPWLFRRNSFPKAESLLIPDMNAKMEKMSEELRSANLQLVSGVPSYLLSLFEHLKESWGCENLAEAFPNLRTCVYSATAIDAWKSQLNTAVGRELNYVGCYASTEGPFGYEIPTLNGGMNGIYQFHLGDIVYLFRKLGEDGKIVRLADLQPGDEVELLLSSPNGLINYSIGDCLKIISVNPTVQFQILGRIGQGMNVAAEKVSMAELNSVIEELSQETKNVIRHFFVYPGRSPSGRANYQWAFAIDNPNPKLNSQWARQVDEILKKKNFDYWEAREELGFIDSPQVQFISAEMVKNFHQSQASRGQFKMKSNFNSEKEFYSFVGKMMEGTVAA